MRASDWFVVHGVVFLQRDGHEQIGLRSMLRISLAAMTTEIERPSTPKDDKELGGHWLGFKMMARVICVHPSV